MRGNNIYIYIHYMYEGFRIPFSLPHAPQPLSPKNSSPLPSPSRRGKTRGTKEREEEKGEREENGGG